MKTLSNSKTLKKGERMQRTGRRDRWWEQEAKREGVTATYRNTQLGRTGSQQPASPTTPAGKTRGEKREEEKKKEEEELVWYLFPTFFIHSIREVIRYACLATAFYLIGLFFSYNSLTFIFLPSFQRVASESATNQIKFGSWQKVVDISSQQRAVGK